MRTTTTLRALGYAVAIAAVAVISVGCATKDARAPIEKTRFVISAECRTGVHPTKATECVEINDHQAECNDVIVDFSCITVNKSYKGKH